MPSNHLEQKATAERLRRLAEEGYLNSQALERALNLAGYIPGGVTWAKFLDYALLILGAAFSVSGVFFFFAYNWANMHRFLKFGLIEVGILTAVGLAFYLGLDKLTGKIALTAAALLVGALLAVFGQVYQTGADAYTLFLTWALLIAGWVVISAYGPLWLGWLVLLNATLITYSVQTLGDDRPLMYAALSGLNATALFAWEAAHQRGIRWLQHRWLPRLITPATFVFLVIPTLEFIFSVDVGRDLEPFLWLMPPLYVGFMVLIIFFYTKKVHDLFMLTVAAFSLIIVVTGTVMRFFDSALDEAIPLLLLSLIVVGQAALAVNWLRRVARSWEVSNV